MNLYSYCYNNPLIYFDPTGCTVQDFLTGMANALDENLTGGVIKWLVNRVLDVDYNYQFDSATDYYLGRVVGDVLSMVTGISSLISGVKTIVASITAGGALSVGSGGTLAIGGISIAVAGTAAGAAEITYGGTVIAASASNFGNDLNKLTECYNGGSKMTTKEADAAAAKSGYTRVKNTYSHGQPVYYNSKTGTYITPDVDMHNGGVWKMADTIKGLGSKSTRLGTYNANLVRIGD